MLARATAASALIAVSSKANPLAPDPRYCGGTVGRNWYLKDDHPLKHRDDLNFTPGVYSDYAVLVSKTGDTYAIAPSMVFSCKVINDDDGTDYMGVHFISVDGTAMVEFPVDSRFVVHLIQTNANPGADYKFTTRTLHLPNIPPRRFMDFTIARASPPPRMPKNLDLLFPEDWSADVTEALEAAKRVMQ